MSKNNFRMLIFLCSLMPLSAIGIHTYGMVVLTTPDRLPLWAAILIGIVAGTLWVAFQMVQHGNTVFELLIGGFIALVLALITLPIAFRAKENRLRKLQRTSLPAGVPAPQRNRGQLDALVKEN